MDLMKLYVGNLPYNISDDQLSDLFAKFGTPDSAKVITDRDSGRSKGFGFVEFSNADQAKQALSLNGTEFGGRSLTVNEARPREERSGYGGGDRGGFGAGGRASPDRGRSCLWRGDRPLRADVMAASTCQAATRGDPARTP